MSFNDLKHAQRERLLFLDTCFVWKGWANRRDLTDRFGVSVAQAALDFKAYLARAGDGAPIYDAERKAYVAGPDHTPLALDETLGAWDTVLRANAAFDELPVLTRSSDPAILAELNRALERGESIRIRYTSMTTGEQAQQWIAPTRFASDGVRIHVRAYSFKHNEYRDYVPVRIHPNSTFETRALEAPLPRDVDWHTIAKVTLIPHRSLSEEQARAVRKEFVFKGDTLVVEIRKALEFYTSRRWGLDQQNPRLELKSVEYRDETTEN